MSAHTGWHERPELWAFRELKGTKLSEKFKALTALSVSVGMRWNRGAQLVTLRGSGSFETESQGTAGPSEGLNIARQSHSVEFLSGDFYQWKESSEF